MKITSVKGTNDYIPSETAIRDYLLDTIIGTYKNNGFEHIMTPVLEDINNLDKSDGGENLNLIFKILKRGQKLNKCIQNNDFTNISDIGLRYDLTLPLSRFYANNKSKLMMPFKCIQIDKVFRAERPQKGRLREFIQCDIDILGVESIDSEIELITTTAEALLAIGMNGFTVKINDRRILIDLLLGLGFEENAIDKVAITLDKLDKIGLDGVKEELDRGEYSSESINALVGILTDLPVELESLRKYCKCEEVLNNLETIIKVTQNIGANQYDIKFDISLVRGQGYYTGTVFEIESNEFKGAIAGGGRYDNLIGKFIKEDVPAVGFSIGFERIFSILLDNGFEVPTAKKKVAVFYDGEEYVKAYQLKSYFKEQYNVSLYKRPKKLGKYLNKLKDYGYYGFCICGEAEEIKQL